jgi:hypothetical protein
MPIEFELVEINLVSSDSKKGVGPVEFHKEIKKPAGDYFTTQELCDFFELSPAELIVLLRAYKDSIRPYAVTMTARHREKFYDSDVDPMECLSMLQNATFHYAEVRSLRIEIIEKQKIALEANYFFPNYEYDNEGHYGTWGGPYRYVFACNEIYGVRDVELEKERNSLREQLTEKETRIAELEKALSTGQDATTISKCDGIGLLPFVCELRRNGRSEKEIATILSDRGRCSNPQIGVLIHPNKDLDAVTASTRTKYAQRKLK